MVPVSGKKYSEGYLALGFDEFPVSSLDDVLFRHVV